MLLAENMKRETWSLVFALLCFLAAILIATEGFGAEHKTCAWMTCYVINGEISVCDKTHGSGSPQAMLEAEKAARGEGHMFLRECIASGEKFQIGWETKGGTFFRKR